jgi:hypothetical protein
VETSNPALVWFAYHFSSELTSVTGRERINISEWREFPQFRKLWDWHSFRRTFKLFIVYLLSLWGKNKVGWLDHLTVCVPECIYPLSALGNGSVSRSEGNEYARNSRRIVWCVIFYAAHFLSKESMRSVLPRNSRYYFRSVNGRRPLLDLTRLIYNPNRSCKYQ